MDQCPGDSDRKEGKGRHGRSAAADDGGHPEAKSTVAGNHGEEDVCDVCFDFAVTALFLII